MMVKVIGQQLLAIIKYGLRRQITSVFLSSCRLDYAQGVAAAPAARPEGYFDGVDKVLVLIDLHVGQLRHALAGAMVQEPWREAFGEPHFII